MTRAGFGLLLLVCAAPVCAAPLPISTCGQVIARGQHGTLVADLDCGEKWGTCRTCTTCFEAVEPIVPCSSPADCPDPLVHRCYSDSGPALPAVAGVFVLPGGRLDMNGHSIRNARNGIAGFGPDGIAGPGRVRVIGPGTVAATREALFIAKGTVIGVTARESVFGIVGSMLTLIDVTALDNIVGVSTFEKARAKRLTADDNRYLGLLSYGGARIISSHLTGNPVDISTEDPPLVVDTVCDHSALLVETAQPGIYEPTGPPFGVCAQD